VERIERDESLVSLRRVVVAQLVQVVLAKIVVNAVLVGAIPELGVVLRTASGPPRLLKLRLMTR
jgi:hypothetical protein